MRIGIDEVGRGSLAGPIYVCAFGSILTDKELLSLFPNKKLKDSKQLKKHEREDIYKKFLLLKKKGAVHFAIGKSSASYIDKNGLTKAVFTSLTKALTTLHKETNYSKKKSFIYLDGGLHAPTSYINQKTIIKGDQKVVVIACASVVAKVLRDQHMKTLAKKYTEYGFEAHVGYGTEKHRLAIQKHGTTKEHRLLFLRKLNKKTNTILPSDKLFL